MAARILATPPGAPIGARPGPPGRPSSARPISSRPMTPSRAPAVTLRDCRPATATCCHRASCLASKPTFRSRIRSPALRRLRYRHSARQATPKPSTCPARCARAWGTHPPIGSFTPPPVWPGAMTDSPARSSQARPWAASPDRAPLKRPKRCVPASLPVPVSRFR